MMEKKILDVTCGSRTIGSSSDGWEWRGAPEGGEGA